MKRRHLASLAVVAGLAACGQQEPRTAAYFAQHKEVRDQVLAECNADRGQRSQLKDQECGNATQAAFMDRGKTRVRTIEEIQAEKKAKGGSDAQR